jgi:hypothetical protein
MSKTRTIEKLLRQQAALANFGSFAFREPALKKVLTEAARVCAESLSVPYANAATARLKRTSSWKRALAGMRV